jgi:hypothetical protein
MQHPAPNMGMWTYLIPLIAIGLVILRNSQARRLRVETLWIMPVVIIVLIGLALSQEGMPTPLFMAIDLAALALGAALGWWRGRLTNITVNPETHDLTSRASPIGMLLILGIFALRYGIRMYASQGAASSGLPVNAIADAALVVTVGLVCAQRLEIALRASRLLAEARAATPPA